MSQINQETIAFKNNNSSNVDNSQRNEGIYYLYLKGETLQSIGKKYSLTRERVRQIVIKVITKRTKTGVWNGTIKNPGHRRLQELIKEEFNKIQKDKILTKTMSKLQSASNKGIIPEKYTSLHKFAKDVGINHDVLEKISPDISQKVKENMSIGHGGKKWSRFYLKCRICGSSTIHHTSHGYCKKCFPKTDIFKDSQMASRLRNKEKWKVHQKEYFIRYYDKKHFGGNRDAVLKRDNYSCVGCGITETQSLTKHGKHLRILHLGNSLDHSINNLITACPSCCLEYIRSK